MTWTVTDRGFAQHTSSAADLVSDTFTPAAECVLIAMMINVDGATTRCQGISGHGTWQQIYYGEDEGPQGTKEFDLWACKTGASPSSGAITVDVNYQPGAQVQFVEIDETAGFPAAVADCFGTPVGASQYNIAEPSVTVAAFASADNLACCQINQNGAGTPGTNFEPSSGYTELAEAGTIWPGAFMYMGSEDTTISAQVNTGNLHTGLLGFEVKHAAAAGTNTIIIVPTGPVW